MEGLTKYNLVKAYICWARDHDADNLTEAEQGQWKYLIEKVNQVLKQKGLIFE